MFKYLSQLTVLIMISISLGSGLVCAAPDPSRPGFPIGGKEIAGSGMASITLSRIQLGDTIMFLVNGPLKDGALFGVYDPKNPNNSVMVLSFPFSAAGGWNYSLAIGAYSSLNGSIGQLLTYPNQIINNNFPFAWQPSVSYSGMNYNGVDYVAAGYPNLLNSNSSANNPMGLQVPPSAISSIVSALNTPANVFFKVLAQYSSKSLTSGSVFEDSVLNGLPGAPSGLYTSQLNISAVNTVANIKKYLNAVISISSQKVLLSAPDGCEVLKVPSGIACPIVGVGSSLNGFSIKSAITGVSFLVGTDQTPVSTFKASVASAKLFLSADWLNNKLGNLKQVVLTSEPLISISSDQQPLLAPFFSLFDSLTINRMDYQIAVTERNPAVKVNDYYQGIIGQTSNLTIPYSIKQSGASKATKVTMSVTGDSTTQDGDGRQYCKFLTDSKPVQSIAVPLSLAFSRTDGSFRKQQDSDCMGLSFDITDMPWTETQGSQFMSELWVDMIFSLSSRRILNDIDGKYWAGSAKAKGSIKVEATWNN